MECNGHAAVDIFKFRTLLLVLQFSWMVFWFVGWLVGWLDGLVGWLVDWMVWLRTHHIHACCSALQDAFL